MVKKGEVVTVILLTIATCFQTAAAWWYANGLPSWDEKAEASVCCASKWDPTDVTGGCCGNGWEIHCCDIQSSPPTCCYGSERIHLHTPSHLNNFFKGIVWMNAIVFTIAVALTLLILFWCCQSFFGFWAKPKVYPSGCHKQHILHSFPNRYGTLLEPVPHDRKGGNTIPMKSTGTGTNFKLFTGGIQENNVMAYPPVRYYQAV